MSARRRTRAELELENHGLRESRTEIQARLKSADQALHEMRERCDDLKERLAFSEAERQRMKGYIERVAEDDVVREELITTGDPEGHQQLVPKRKHAPPGEFISTRGATVRDGFEMPYSDRCAERARTTRHWVTY